MTSNKSWLKVLAWGYVKGIMYVTGGRFGRFHTKNHTGNSNAFLPLYILFVAPKLKKKPNSVA
jgi:hypothetical protein